MEFNVEPYNDDFQQNAKDNNYLRILFKPGFSVQARELTQVQSILQNQIKAFGDHIFQDGSPVIGGNLTLDNNMSYLKLDETYNSEDVELDLFVDQIILRDSDSLVQAKVLASYYPSGGTPTLMIKYLSGVTFDDGDVFKVAGTTTKAKCIDSSSGGRGTVVSINDGIFYVDGFFVTVTPQTATVAAYSQHANVKIGLEVTDDIIDSTIDTTLLDPAQDSFNYQAPGADRYQFSLALSTRPLDTAVDESQFFELMRVEKGVITKQIKYPIYSEIEKTLARRTFDESGDYTITPFRASVAKSANDANYILNIEPGKAYVKGFEFETIGTYKIEVQKPRTAGTDDRSMVDIDFGTSYGNYLKFKNVWGSNLSSFLDTEALETVDLHCVHAANVAAGVSVAANNFVYGNTKIGTAKIRNVSRDIAASDGLEFNDSNGVYNFYMTDISIKPRILKLEAAGSSGNTITLPPHASKQADAYLNVSLTVLPISLTAVPNVNVANVWANSTVVNANSAVASVFSSGNVRVGWLIRVGDETKQIVRVNTAGDYLVVNTAFSKTINANNKDTHPLQVFIQNTASSNVTTQTRRIIAYAETTRVATLHRKFDDSANPIADAVVQLNYGIKDIESVMDASLPFTSTIKANAHANIAIQSLLVNDNAEMFEPSRKPVIFRLPNSTVKRGSLDNIDYVHTKYIAGAAVTAGAYTVALEAFESIPWSVTNNNIEDNLIIVIREASATYTNGSIFKATTANVAVNGSTIDLSIPTTIGVIDIYTTVKENDTEDRVRTKTLRRNSTLAISPFDYPLDTGVNIDFTVNVPNANVAGSNNVAKINVANGLIFITDPAMTRVHPGDSISLYVPDVIKIRKILAGNATSVATADNYRDITDNFTVNFGQTDEMYDHAYLTLKQGYHTPNCMLTVHVDFYQHTYPTGASFFSVDSYSEAIYNAGTIPIYYSRAAGVHYLRDCLDFRPTRRIGVASGLLDVGVLPSADASTELSFDYYLPRIDKLVLSKDKSFRVIKGISSPTPVPPDDDADSMTLYTIYLPPYVATVNDVRLLYNENRRYTMKDISRIDKRVQSIEYYTALNNIENRALADGSKYEDGTDKTKFGIIGEGFRNYNIADYKNPDFKVTMKEDEMGPHIGNAPLAMKVFSTSTVRQNERTMTLNFTEETMVSQALTTGKLISVQPFLFAQFMGDCTLSPEMDFWVSEELTPDVLRSPQVESIIREIFGPERIAELFDEADALTTVLDPTTNAQSIVITTAGSDTLAPANTSPHVTTSSETIIPHLDFTPRNRGFIGNIWDDIRLLFPVLTPPRAPIPPAPSTTLPVYIEPVRATRSSRTQNFIE
jgi:hypothetical protein